MSQNNDPLIYHEEGEIGFIEITARKRKMHSITSAGSYSTSIVTN